MYNLSYKMLLDVDMDFSSFVLHSKFLFSHFSCAECIRLRRGLDVESSFFSIYDLRETLSFMFLSLPSFSWLGVNRNISFAWLIVYLIEHLKLEFRSLSLELLLHIWDSLVTQLLLPIILVLQQIVCLNAFLYFMLIKLYKMGFIVVLK